MNIPTRGAVLLIALLAMPDLVLARLGETELESQKRYGVPVDTKTDTRYPVLAGAVNHVYNYEGWRLRVAFLNGRAVRIVYSKKSGAPGAPGLKDDEIQAVLAGEAGGGQWTKASSVGINPLKSFATSITRPHSWANSNGRTAYINTGCTTITVETADAEAFTQAQQAEKERQRKANIPNF